MREAYLKDNSNSVEGIENSRIEYLDLNSGMKVIVNYCDDEALSKCAENKVKALLMKAYSSKIID